MLAELLQSRFFKGANNTKVGQRATYLGSAAMAQVELPLTETARAGRLFHGGLQLAANGIAPDATLPTTTAKVGLYNSDSDGGKTIFIDNLHHFVVSGTPAATSTLWVCVSRGKLATPVAADVTGFGSAPTRGMVNTTSIARWGTGITLPAGTIWRAVGSNFQLAAANFAMGDQPFEIRGGIAIPPGYCMGLAILSGAGTTPLYAPNAAWAELEADLE